MFCMFTSSQISKLSIHKRSPVNDLFYKGYIFYHKINKCNSIILFLPYFLPRFFISILNFMSYVLNLKHQIVVLVLILLDNHRKEVRKIMGEI